MLYWLSKAVVPFLHPVNWALAAIWFGVVTSFLGYKSWGQKLVALGIILVSIVAVVPLGNWLSKPLENRFPSPKIENRVPRGIIVLGGATEPEITWSRDQPSVNSAADRLIVLASLMKKYPQAAVVVSGGGTSKSVPLTEAAVARLVLDIMGIDVKRISFEQKSRNTYENATFSAELVSPNRDESWLLITSALHMPRAVGSFRRVGWNVIPFPVDYETPADSKLNWVGFNLSSNSLELNRATREWVGLVSYWFLGRTNQVFPGPSLK